MFRFIFAFIFFLHSTALAMPLTMSLADVKPGMSATAYTVFDSTGVIKPFNIRIEGTLQNGKSLPYIVAVASGDLINRTGGVLQGMSGSPVYINGKIIGAVSATFKEMSPFHCLITPIDSMTPIWNLPDSFIKPPIKVELEPEIENVTEVETDEEIKTNTEVETDGEIKTNTEVETNSKTENSTESENNSESATESETAALVLSSGLNTNFLSSVLPNQNFSYSDAPDYALNFNSDIQAGSPFGVAVVVGDFFVGATGTVTATDGNKLLGFGHSFVHLGNVNYFMTEAQVVSSVSGPTSGMKLAAMGPIIGRINQDREAGVAGIIGQFPSTVPISVSVNDDKYSAVMAYNENLIPQLGAAIAYSALNEHADSLSGATVKLSFDIKTNIVNSGVFSRENLFYGAADVGQIAVTELMSALNLISTNQTAESDIFGIDVKINYETLRKTASLVSATPSKALVKPGEEVKLQVKLKPYRSKEVTVEIPYTVPATAAEGALMLDLHGGGLVPVVASTPAGVVLPSTKTPAQQYEEKIQQLLTANKNNEIIVKPTATPKTEKELLAEIKRLKKLSKMGIEPKAVKPVKFATDYVIDNVIQCKINVGRLDG